MNNIKPINVNLQSAKSAFLKKDLTLALQLTQSLIAHPSNTDASFPSTSAHIFLGKILSTKGRYVGDTSHFSEALEVLKHIDRTTLDNIEKTNLFLVYSEIYLFTDDWDQAHHFAHAALEESQSQNDIAKIVESLVAKSEVFIIKNQFDEAIQLANQALEYVGKIEHNLLKADVYNLLCKIYIKRQEYSYILKYCNEVLKISKEHGDIEKEIIASSNLAVYYGSNIDYKSSMEYFFSSLEKSKSIHFDRLTAQNLVNIGTIYANLFNSKGALNKYETVIEEYNLVLPDTTKTILYNNIGKIHFGKKQYDQSEKYFHKALARAEEIQYSEMIALSLAHLARTSYAQNKLEETFAFADRANELLEDMGDVDADSINLLNFANLANHSGDYETAIKHLTAGIEISKKVKNEENEIACYQLLSKIYEKRGDFEDAFNYKTLYATTQQAYLKKQSNRQILDQEIKFVTREKEQQIEALQKENSLQAMLLKKQEEVKLANERLTQANEELKQFAYVASHDLKEPLRMIGSYTQIINKKFEAETDEDTQTFFDYVTDGVNRMNNLLDGLLQYSTVGRGAQDLKPVNLNDTLIICQSNLRLLIAESNVNIVADELPTVLGISSLLSQLFQNLISNAIKFRKKEGQPEIIIKTEEKENEYLISIKDNGIGIKPEYKNRIFVIFQRLHARTDYEGTGIGLAICHKIMQRMGGKIWVESELGEGATFFFTFPKKELDVVLD